MHCAEGSGAAQVLLYAANLLAVPRRRAYVYSAAGADLSGFERSLPQHRSVEVKLTVPCRVGSGPEQDLIWVSGRCLHRAYARTAAAADLSGFRRSSCTTPVAV